MVVQRLQTLCPRLGKVKIAQILGRAGLHLGATTIGRMRKRKPIRPPEFPPRAGKRQSSRRVTAKYPNHLWHVDLTTVATTAGFWVSWLPFALPQCWPYCWWVAVVLDHYSRRALGFAIFWHQPSSMQMRRFLGRVITRCGSTPRHLVTDHGKQFTSDPFKVWCRRRDICQRFGAVGKQGSIAVIERFHRTLKEGIRELAAIPLSRRLFHREVILLVRWYNTERPHTTLKGATPDEMYFRQRPTCRKPRFEPRRNWPRPSPCARPQVLVKGHPGVHFAASVDFLAHRRHLPRVTLTRVA
jgi:transposase InsO family protein